MEKRQFFLNLSWKAVIDHKGITLRERKIIHLQVIPSLRIELRQDTHLHFIYVFDLIIYPD